MKNLLKETQKIAQHWYNNFYKRVTTKKPAGEADYNGYKTEVLHDVKAMKGKTSKRFQNIRKVKGSKSPRRYRRAK